MVCAGAEGFINTLFHGVTDSLGNLAAGLGTFWVNTPSIPLTGEGNAVAFIRDTTTWYVSVLMVISVLIAAGQMAWTCRGQPLTDLLASLLKFAIVNGAGVAGVTLLLESGDEFSRWIIEKATGEGFEKALSRLIGPEAFSTEISVGLALFAIILGIFAIIIAVIQIGLLIVRSAMALLLMGTLPLAYAATNTQWGRQWSQKHTAWLIAFVLYKPVASLVYAAAFKVFGSYGQVDGDDTQRMLYFVSGLVLMVAALFALPAMMRLIVPAVSATSGAGSAAFAGAALGSTASGAVHTGSRMRSSGFGMVTRGVRMSGNGSGSGSSGASGAGGGSAGSGSVSGASAAKGAAGVAGGVALAGVGAAVAVVGAAASATKKGGQAVGTAVHEAAGEPAPVYGPAHQLRSSRGRTVSGSRGSSRSRPKPKPKSDPQPAPQPQPKGAPSGA